MKKSAEILLMACVMAGSMVASQSFAEERESGVSVVFYGGLTFGGDEIVEVEYDDGSDGTVDAGGFFLFGGGVNYRLENSPFDMQATLGYHFDSESAENADIEFTRMPVDLIGFYNVEQHRIGAGITYHLNPEFSIDIDSEIDESFDFDNALGLVLEYNYRYSKSGGIGVRFTKIEYTSASGADFDGSYVGIVANYFL